MLEGYDIYRDGVLVAEAVKTRGSWTDSYKPQGKITKYNIKPVVRRNGTLTRGFMSNTAYVETSSIIDIENSTDSDAEYFNLQGLRVINPSNGIYIKVKDGKATKVMLK